MSLLQSTNLYFKSYLFISRRLPTTLVAFSFIVFTILFSGCGGSRPQTAEEKLRKELCAPIETTSSFDETPYVGGTAIVLSYQNIRAGLNAACASCHMAPAANGGFTYIDSWQGRDLTLDGKTKWYQGFSESAEKMRDYIFHENESKRMPPPERRNKDPEVFLALGRQLNLWMVAGKPNGTFEAGKVPEERRGKFRPVRPKSTTALGDCTPSAKAIGYDYKMDRQFEQMKSLPKYLRDTDLFSLDSYTLATNGTLSYNVEYPLWADNAEKGRWVHVPMKLEGNQLKKQAIEYDLQTQQFKIPENTRFYKSFYRAVKLPNKKIKMRRMETRIIVTRANWQEALFGTYQWDESEQVATLVEAPYRDGTPWKDIVFDVIVDEKKETARPYAIPGRQRCIDCHMGSPMQNFILGFQPLQINRRPLGGAAREEKTELFELNQVQRFLSYGLIEGLNSVHDLPILESITNVNARNAYELRANGYTVGNCYHCHNPNGLAFTKENGIQLLLGPGDLFQFGTQQKSVQIATRRIVHQNGELDSSHMWRKISDSPGQLGMFSQMPMHTPGSPDCRVMTVVGKWIRSFESLNAAETWYPSCKKENPFFWIDLDFTWVDSEIYTPRRNDWKDAVNGMPERYRQIELSPDLEKSIQTEYPVGYWLKKPECNFPEVDIPPEQRRPWMMKGDKPKRPFGEVYSTTPGAYFFRNTCVKCHGPGADGNSSLARGILNWSGGGVRVANLIGGMFGQKNENLKIFDLNGKNYAGQYLIWMAMEGTRVKFPPEVSSFMGKHGGQMLNGLREKCLAQISTDKPSSPFFMDHEVFNKVCFMQNLSPGHADLRFDPATNRPIYPERVDEWLDRSAWNTGWSIYEFLRSMSQGVSQPSNDQCELMYGSHAREGT